MPHTVRQALSKWKRCSFKLAHFINTKDTTLAKTIGKTDEIPSLARCPVSTCRSRASRGCVPRPSPR